MDCSGNVAAHRLCIDAAWRKGQVAFVGECGAETPFRASQDLICKGLTLVGSWHYNLADVAKVFRVACDCAEQLDRLITHVFPLGEVEEAWRVQESGECAKVILQPW